MAELIVGFSLAHAQSGLSSAFRKTENTCKCMNLLSIFKQTRKAQPCSVPEEAWGRPGWT